MVPPICTGFGSLVGRALVLYLCNPILISWLEVTLFLFFHFFCLSRIYNNYLVRVKRSYILTCDLLQFVFPSLMHPQFMQHITQTICTHDLWFAGFAHFNNALPCYYYGHIISSFGFLIHILTLWKNKLSLIYWQ